MLILLYQVDSIIDVLLLHDDSIDMFDCRQRVLVHRLLLEQVRLPSDVLVLNLVITTTILTSIC